MGKNMETKAANQINFDYNGKHYCLEFTRETIRQMEAAGFKPAEVYDKPELGLEQMWAGAFLANHRKTSNTVISKILDEMKNRSKLRDKLLEMVAETYESLFPEEDDSDQGNVEWTAT